MLRDGDCTGDNAFWADYINYYNKIRNYTFLTFAVTITTICLVSLAINPCPYFLYK